MAEDKRKPTPRDILRMAFRRRRMFVLGAAVFAISALIGAEYMPLKYTGTTIFERRTDTASLETTRSRTEMFESIKLTLQHELVGRTAMERAVTELNLTRGMHRGPDGELTFEGQMAKQELVKRLMDRTQAKFDVRSPEVDLISVSFTDEDPDLAQKMPNTLVRNYITKISEEIVSRLTQSRDFLQTQVRNADGRLQEATRERIDFEAQHGGMLPDSPSALQERMRQLSTDMDTIRRQGAVATQALERLKAMAEKAADAPGEPIQVVKGPNPELDRLKEDLRTFKDDLANALTLRHMTEKHPTVQTLHKKIEEIEKEIEETPEETVIQKVYGSEGPGDNLAMALAAAQSEVEMADKELERLQGRLNAVQLLVANYAPVRQAYLELSTKVGELEAEKKSWHDRLTGVQMALEAEVAKRRTHLNAVQLAEKQFRPSSPKVLYVLGFALVGGLAFGGAVVFLSNTLDRSISATQDAAKHFGLPVCGVIDEIVTPGERLWRNVRRFIAEPTIALILVAIIGVASLNIALWLHYPEEHKQWKDDPTAFVSRRAAYYYQRGVQKLRQSP